MSGINFKSSSFMKTNSFFLVLVILFSFGCGKEEKKEIRLGAILPLTGDAALYGTTAKNAIDLARDEINSAGGIHGEPLGIIYEDSQAKADLAINAMNKLVNINHVPAIIGPMSSSEVMALAPIANSKKVVLISPAATSHEVTNAGDYVFRTIVSDIFDGTAMARFISECGISNVAVIYALEAGPEGVAKAFIKEFQKLGGNIALTDVSQRGDRDFRTQIIKLNGKEIKAVYFALYPNETEIFVRQYRELGIGKPLFTHQLIDDPDILRKLGKGADGIIFTSPKLTIETGGTIVNNFYNDFTKKYGKEPQNFASNAYDATKLLAHAIQKFGEKPENIKSGLYSVKSYEGASGILSIDQNGDVDQKMQIMIIKNSKPVKYRDRKN